MVFSGSLGTPLINPITVRITPIDAANQDVDPLSRTAPARVLYKPELQMDGQLEPASRRNRMIDALSGADVSSVMQLTLRREDADAVDYTPRTGDKIVGTVDECGRQDDTVLYVNVARPSGAWRQGFSLWICDLSDRVPTRKVAS